MTWAIWFDDIENRRVALTEIGGLTVSTVCLGLNHSYHRDSPPMLFETMVFGTDETEKGCYRTYTWDGALVQHQQVVAFLQAEEMEEQDADADVGELSG